MFCCCCFLRSERFFPGKRSCSNSAASSSCPYLVCLQYFTLISKFLWNSDTFRTSFLKIRWSDWLIQGMRISGSSSFISCTFGPNRGSHLNSWFNQIRLQSNIFRCPYQRRHKWQVHYITKQVHYITTLRSRFDLFRTKPGITNTLCSAISPKMVAYIYR